MNPFLANKQDREALLVDLKQIAYKARQNIVAIYERGFSVKEQSDNTPVTKTDFAAHRIIPGGLQAQTQDIPILFEEYSPRHTVSAPRCSRYRPYTSKWDTTAAQIVVVEAGGQLTPHGCNHRVTKLEKNYHTAFLVFGDKTNIGLNTYKKRKR